VFAIRYTLTALEDIEPWGSVEKTLGWYAMSYGRQCIETDAARLLEYFDPQTSQSQWCDYQVARLFEDLLAIWPHASEQIPDDIVAFFKSDGAQDLDEAIESWIAAALDATDDADDDRIERIDRVRSWWAQRYIQFAHLSGLPELAMWRIGDTMHLRWSGDESWPPRRAGLSLPFDTVRAGITDFANGFLADMQARMSLIAHGGNVRADCVIDLARCLSEQREREAQARHALSTQAATDWPALWRLLRDCA